MGPIPGASLSVAATLPGKGLAAFLAAWHQHNLDRADLP